ncbi:MAG: hypothetical protein Q9226_002098 [Calogaya cf. arnoldii]
MSGDSSGAADSSSATVGASLKPSIAWNKTRLEDTSVERSTSSSRPDLDLRQLFRALCVATRRLQQCAQDDSNGYAVEHLKMALRASPEQASEMTGMSLRMTDYMFHAAEGFVTRYNIFDLMISPWVTVWNSPKVDIDKAIDVLEDLLLQHVITPARNTFEISKKARAGMADEDQGATIGSLLGPLCNETACHKDQITSLVDSVEAIHPVAHFYGIAVKHTPLGTSKERIASRPWLQFMFDRLSDQLESHTAAPTQISSKPQDYTLAIRQMLEILVVHKVNLGTAMLERVLVKVSQILNSKADQVDWHIVGLCLKIDSDVFVIPNNTDTSKATPNKFLAALFTRLNDLSDSSTENDETPTLVLREVLVPLVEGFAHARNLTGFIAYWISNMIQLWISATNSGLQPAANGSTKVFSSQSRTAQCIWEREGLIQAVAGLLESHLTDRQIELLLQEANTTVESAKTTSESTARLDSSATLVILDCVLSGCTNENTIEHLLMTIQNTYVALLGLRKAKGLPITLRWRVWRCIATIKDRWQVEIAPIPDLRHLEDSAAEDALKIQTQKDQRNDPEEQFHSFNFLISIIDKNLPLAGKALAESTVQLVISLLGHYAELVISFLPDASGSILPRSSYDLSPEKLEKLLASQASTLRYTSVMCDRITALSSVSQQLQRKFIEGIFECDLLDMRRLSRHTNPPFEHSTPWKPLLDWKNLEETGSLADTYRAFQLDKLFNREYWRKQQHISDSAIELSAFENIDRIPRLAFSRKEQTSIFNNALLYLPPHSQLLKKYLKLLIKFLVHPNKDFNILRFPPYEGGKLILLKIADYVSSHCVDYYVDTEAIELLKLLVQQVLDYQLSSDDGVQAAMFLTSYYLSLIAVLSRVPQPMQEVSNEDTAKGKSVGTAQNELYPEREDSEKEDSEQEESEEEEPKEEQSEGDPDEEDDLDHFFSMDAEPVELNIYSVVVISASLDFYQRHAKNLPAEIQNSLQFLPSIRELRTPVLDALCEWISSGRGHFTKPISEVCSGALNQSVAQSCQAAAAQYVEALYHDCFLGRPLHISISECVEDLATNAAQRSQITRMSDEDISELKEALRLLRETQRLFAMRYEYSPLEAYRKATDTRNTLSEQQQLVQIVVDSNQEFGPEIAAGMVAQLVNQDDGKLLDRNAILLLQSLIVHLIKSDTRSSEATFSALSSTINNLSDALLQPQPYQVLVMSFHSINTILHKLPRMITQWHVDQIMAVITHRASDPASTSNYGPKQIGLQYLALCRVFSTILAFHRKRLGGRYHLIVVVLQALLRPLFMPFRTVSTSSPETYTGTHAKAYSRLLLQLADPPLSSVSNHKKHSKHHSLNDPTKIAKSIAGQHLHYLIMTYCDCQLDGRLTQEVRETMRPGIWAVLDVLPQETMRVMNAGMDKAGRAVWKGLYEEWRRDRRGAGRGR